MTRIKICGITREQDLLAAVTAGADALGFVFYAKSPRNVELPQASQLLRAVPPFVTSVGLFVDPSEEMVRDVLAHMPLDVLQFHGDESPVFCGQFGRPYLKAIRVKAGVDLVECAARYADAQGLLLDAFVEGVQGGTGESFDWGLIPKELASRVVLSGGLHPHNVAEAVRTVRPYAVDVSSGVEASKGIKDAAKIAAFIKEVKNVDIQLS
ncbi:MAG: phosphoribosylanthranilate isomerase [Gammaproteobacteria bacterium]|nr:phosphoribosylanthranilate isomerase [Gammaproteobacteria bacterium]MBU1625397.1 phosphoribosylanthranilate isomerase [Gammaproteobacteria bacterium]MBU1981657.1 phosphoribosylanthranilate isomerase [Gammaproteobacteria bacterium]